MNFNLIVYLCSTPPQHQDETGRKLKIFKDTDQRVGVRSEILPIFVAPGWNLSGAPPGTSAAGSRGHFGNNADLRYLGERDTVPLLIPCHTRTAGMECH